MFDNKCQEYDWVSDWVPKNNAKEESKWYPLVN